MEWPTLSRTVVVAMILVSTLASTCLCLKQDIFAVSYADPCIGTPGCAWDVFKNGSTLAIINPNSGPGEKSDSSFVDLVNTLKINSTVKTVVGYVLTNYSNRDPALVVADITAYYSWYNIDGIFFDEGSTSCDNVTLYKSYDDEVKAKGGLAYTVLNWGVNGPECYLTSTNITSYVTFEGKTVFALEVELYSTVVLKHLHVWVLQQTKW